MIIRPDPAHPRGGYAGIQVGADAVSGPEVSLTLRNSFNDKYLGEDGWQSEKAFFGPYSVRAEGDKAEFVVGTEIVNQIEEYTALVIAVDGREFEVSWPDDIRPGPPAATVGGVSATPPKTSADTGPTLVGKVREEPEPVEAPEPEEPTVVDEPEAGAKPDTDAATLANGKGGSRVGIIALVVLLALAGAGGLYWFLTQDEPVAETEEDEEQETDEIVVPEPDPCSPDGLNALVTNGYGGLIAGLQACDGLISADDALGLIEQGVDAGDPAALVAMGQLYDGDVDIDIVETRMGLTLTDDPSRAAEYYARAVQAGDGVGAAEALAQVCTGLETATDTLSQGAWQDYCAQ